MFVVLETAFDGVEDPGVVERGSEDVDAEGLQDGDGSYDVVEEIEDDEVGVFESICGGESNEDLALKRMRSVFFDAEG